jgi:hypothetical protein
MEVIESRPRSTSINGTFGCEVLDGYIVHRF